MHHFLICWFLIAQQIESILQDSPSTLQLFYYSYLIILLENFSTLSIMMWFKNILNFLSWRMTIPKLQNCSLIVTNLSYIALFLVILLILYANIVRSTGIFSEVYEVIFHVFSLNPCKSKSSFYLSALEINFFSLITLYNFISEQTYTTKFVYLLKLATWS